MYEITDAQPRFALQVTYRPIYGVKHKFYIQKYIKLRKTENQRNKYYFGYLCRPTE